MKPLQADGTVLRLELVKGRAQTQGMGWREGDPAGLTVCPAGGAPQDGKGQPQQHGFWLPCPKAPGKKGQATRLSEKGPA